MKLKDRVAIVTGGAQGIGRGTALCLAREGADIVIADIAEKEAEKVVNEIKALGRKAIALKVDVTKSKDTNQMVDDTLKEFGKIDILVNVAGGSARKRNALFHESKEEVWDYVINMNLKGTLLCTRAVINHMIERRSGCIVNIGSVDGIQGSGMLRADYSAAKGGVIAFTKALAKEVSSYGVRVNCVSPGTIDTGGFRSNPKEAQEATLRLHYTNTVGKPEDIGHMVTFLVSDDASYIVGENYAVAGGMDLGGKEYL
jgi:NAD(P)-dependent dehydrogenase (short-subunit alcohol dehydrogenase family)